MDAIPPAADKPPPPEASRGSSYDSTRGASVNQEILFKCPSIAPGRSSSGQHLLDPGWAWRSHLHLTEGHDSEAMDKGHLTSAMTSQDHNSEMTPQVWLRGGLWCSASVTAHSKGGGWIQSYLLLWGELCPQKTVPVNATLFGNRILVDLTSLRWGHNPVGRVCHKKGKSEHRHTEGDGGRGGVATAQRCLGHKSWRWGQDPLPEPLEGAQPHDPCWGNMFLLCFCCVCHQSVALCYKSHRKKPHIHLKFLSFSWKLISLRRQKNYIQGFLIWAILWLEMLTLTLVLPLPRKNIKSKQERKKKKKAAPSSQARGWNPL